MRMGFVRHAATGLRRASRAVNAAAQWAAAGFLCLMVAVVTIQVFARYGLRDAPAWTEEAARYAMVWSALLGATCAFHNNADPVLVNMAASPSRRLRLLTRCARFVCVTVFAGPMLYYSVGMVARSSLRHTETMGLNLACVTIIVPIFSAVVLFHAFAKLVEIEPAEEGAEAG